MYKAIIVEDELNSKELLSLLLERFYKDKIDLVDTCDTCEEAISSIDNHQPTLVFMDINLPDGTGFDILDKAQNKNFFVIFTTAYDQYAIKAFKYNSIDYLMKPIIEEELSDAIAKLDHLSVLQEKDKMEHLLENIKNNGTKQKLAISLVDEIIYLTIDDIIKIQASSAYAIIYAKDQKPIMSSKSLGHYEDLLEGSGFYRVHHSWLVNMNFIKTYQKEGIVVLHDHSEIPVSARKQMEFKNHFKKHLK